ncbi:Nif11-like leader peptide family natural product precursor [Prochlorococcus sp. MIT 1307]|uniref:Nif11-like leader peptide family natural product precursor n=1 Tax=Prochlorococcus sp. MIT 1307 TaxID=3096219 RepID=UPI002A7634BB|nr:Nif11-like leader peptide family natural product precursor [Prochlorococcus sp. MIT 1307]
MSREEARNFLHAVEHSLSLRSKLKQCKKIKEILEVASDYGFSITEEDLIEDTQAQEIIKCFQDNKINPINKL